MKRILINAELPNEVRVAYLEDGKLVDFEIESSSQTSVKGNIYVGVVTAVKVDLEGAFVDIGEERHGLLAFSKAGGRGSRETRSQPSEEPVEIEHPDLQAGQKVLVQVFREARGEKGSALSMELSLPGRFIVLKPNSNVRAVTRNVSEVQRMRLRELGNQLPNVENVGWIMRTTAVNHTLEEITSDFHRLMNLWRNIQRAYEENQQRAPVLVFSDNTLMQRVLRDRLRRDGTKVIVDDPSLYRESRNYASDFMPELRDQIEHYRGDRPIFDTFRVENAVASVFSRKVTLPAGGELVFDPTEALLSIDVNSAKNTGGETLEETALHTNLEAAEEICRQLMIRNIGGLVVVDFIDMLTEGYNEQVEQVVRQCLARDTANSECSVISEFGLMQLNRQRRRSSIYDTHFEECESCQGAFVKRTETNANQVLRKLSYLIHDPSRQENQYLCRVPDDVAFFILNKERQYLRDLELNTRKQVIIIADATLTNGTFDIKSRRIKGIDYEGGSNLEELLHETRQDTLSKDRPELPAEPRANPQPLVSPVGNTKPKKKKQKSSAKVATHGKKKQHKAGKQKHKKSAISSFFSAMFGTDEKKTKKSKKTSSTGQKRTHTKSDRRTQPSSKTQRRNVSSSDRSRSGRSKSDQRSKVKSAKREEKPQRVSSQTSHSSKAPRRDRTSNREKTPRTATRTADDSSGRSKVPSDNVRRAADLKQSADAVPRDERKSQDQDSSIQNRRAPRSSRTVGPNTKSSNQKQRGRQPSEPRRARENNGRQRDVEQNVEEHSESASPAERRPPRRGREPSDNQQSTNPTSSASDIESSSQEKRNERSEIAASTVKESKSSDESKFSDGVDSAATGRQFAANDPRASNQAVTDDNPSSEANVDSNQSNPKNESSDGETASPTQVDSNSSKTSVVQSEVSSNESQPEPEIASVHSPAREEGPSESGRAANDPRSRIETES